MPQNQLENIDKTFIKVDTDALSGDINKIISAPTGYAGFWIRVLARIIDYLLVFMVLSPFLFVRLFMANADIRRDLITFAVCFIVFVSYFSIMTYLKGGTLGKMILGIQVISDKSNKLSFMQVVLREIIALVSIQLYGGLITIITVFTKRKQSLHDKITGTLVVYKNK